LHFIDFVQLAKSLTRRANQGHKYIIAKIVKPARSNPPRAFSLRFSSLSFSNRTAAACHDAAPSSARRLGVAGAPSSEPLQLRIIGKSLPTFPNDARKLAGARERVGMRRGRSPRPLAVPQG
jgi:hypothetical protein